MNRSVQCTCKGVVIDKLYNTLGEDKSSIFLCKPKTFVTQLDYSTNPFKNRDSEATKLSNIFARPMVFERPLTS